MGYYDDGEERLGDEDNTNQQSTKEAKYFPNGSFDDSSS